MPLISPQLAKFKYICQIFKFGFLGNQVSYEKNMFYIFDVFFHIKSLATRSYYNLLPNIIANQFCNTMDLFCKSLGRPQASDYQYILSIFQGSRLKGSIYIVNMYCRYDIVNTSLPIFIDKSGFRWEARKCWQYYRLPDSCNSSKLSACNAVNLSVPLVIYDRYFLL